MSKKSPEYIEKVTEELLFETPKGKTKAVLILGGTITTGSLTETALEGFQNGDFDEILISGGVKVHQMVKGVPAFVGKMLNKQLYAKFLAAENKKMLNDFYYQSDVRLEKEDFTSDKTEAAYIRDYLIENGVPEDKIVFVDETAMNTGQNMKAVKGIIQEKGYDSITLVTHAYHQKRALATFRKEMGHDIDVVFEEVYPFGVTKDNWATIAGGQVAKIVEIEYQNLNLDNPKNYIAKGFCVELDMAQEKQRMLEYSQNNPRNFCVINEMPFRYAEMGYGFLGSMFKALKAG